MPTPDRGQRRLGPALVALLVIVAAGVVLNSTVGPRAGEDGVNAADEDGDALATLEPGPPSDAGGTDPAVSDPPTDPDPASEHEPELVEYHVLTIETEPAGATVTVTAGDGEVTQGETPFRSELPAGRVDLEVSADDHQTITKTIDLGDDVGFAWELGPPGLLHRKLGEFATGAAPKQVAFSLDGSQIWVSLLGGRGVEVYDSTTYERLAEVTLGSQGGAVEIIFDSEGDTAFASQMESASAFEVDTSGFEVRRQLDTGGSWSKVMALSSDESTLYVSNWTSNDVSEIDLASGELRRRIPTVSTPRGLYPAADGDRLYVAGFDSGDLARIDLDDGSSVTILSTGGAIRHLVGDGERLYASDMGTDRIHLLELDGEEVSEFAATDVNPNTIALSPEGRVLYVSNRGRNNPESYYLPGPEWGSILAFDAATGEPLDAIVGGNQPTGLDVSPDGTMLAFSDFLDDRVQVFEIPSYEVLSAGDGGRFGPHRMDMAK